MQVVADLASSGCFDEALKHSTWFINYMHMYLYLFPENADRSSADSKYNTSSFLHKEPS